MSLPIGNCPSPEPCSARPTARVDGMTLIELLLAITLFSTLFASVTGLLRSAIQSQVRWGGAVEPYRQMETALRRLEDDLEASQLFFGAPFAGTEQRLEAARVDTLPTTDGQSTKDWVQVVYRLDGDADGLWLIREAFGWRTRGMEAGPPRQERLVRLSRGSFAFGVRDQQGQLTWSASWDGKTQGVPRLVKFDMTLPAIGTQAPISLSRVVRNPAGQLPQVETTP